MKNTIQSKIYIFLFLLTDAQGGHDENVHIGMLLPAIVTRKKTPRGMIKLTAIFWQ